ncbi:hypothetical protein HDV00_006845 [Rhizophlyctis rosea]|nr:hypothetical protein HDV00_006845 [Rhizophlyctis rosea]
MIPIGRGIPSISGPTGAAPHGGDDTALYNNQQQQPFASADRRASAPAAFDHLLGRRRSSIDNILENLKYVGAFPSRLMADFSHNRAADPNHSAPSSTQSSTTSLFSHPSLTRLPSFTETPPQQPTKETLNFSQAVGGTKAATDKGVKRTFPSAEEFLTF